MNQHLSKHSGCNIQCVYIYVIDIATDGCNACCLFRVGYSLFAHLPSKRKGAQERHEPFSRELIRNLRSLTPPKLEPKWSHRVPFHKPVPMGPSPDGIPRLQQGMPQADSQQSAPQSAPQCISMCKAVNAIIQIVTHIYIYINKK